jgi:hypothetical protein
MSNGERIRSPTRSVDDLVQAMGMEGISKSQVSRLCAEIPDVAKLLSPSGWRESDVTRLEAAAMQMGLDPEESYA